MGPASAEASASGRTRSDDGTSTAPRFGEAVAPLHQRFDVESLEDIYVVGDVHGCIDELRDLLDRLDPGDDPVVDTHARLMREARDAAERARADDDVVLDLEDPLAPDEFEGPP